MQELEAVLSEAEEDHLGVALIQPGGSRYEQMRWQYSAGMVIIALDGRLQQGWNRVFYVPCNL